MILCNVGLAQRPCGRVLQTRSGIFTACAILPRTLAAEGAGLLIEFGDEPRGSGLEIKIVRASSSAYLPFKRAIDFVFGILLLLISIPAMVAIALAIKLESVGPVLFHQERVGLGGRIFTIHKFRSMSTLSPRYSYKVPLADPRVTRVGRLLRRSGLDELPQLWNVIRGEMSLIGPRPELPFIVDQYQPAQHLRHSVRPGITGWWQIHQRNSPRTMGEDSADPSHMSRMAYDRYYLERLSLRLDLIISLRTMRIIIECLLRQPDMELSANGRQDDDAVEPALSVETTSR